MTKRRILSLLLALAMVLAYMPMMTFADGETDDLITDASISIPRPIEKGEVGPEAYTSLQPNITVPEDAGYSVKYRCWVKNAEGEAYPYSVYVYRDTTYYIKVILEDSGSK